MDRWLLNCFVHAAAALALLGACSGLLLKRKLLNLVGVVAGTAAMLIVACLATIEVLSRTFFFGSQLAWDVSVSASGLLDVLAVALALLFSYRYTRTARTVTALFWVLMLGVVCLSLQLAPARQLENNDGYLVPSVWASAIMSGGALLLAAFTLAFDRNAYRRRVEAVPAHLERLTSPPAAWPGFRYSAGIVGAMVLILGCVYAALPWTSPSVLLAGAALLAIVHRNWNESLADVALALITLSVVALCLLGISEPVWSPAGFETVLSRALLGLAVMTWYWPWLAHVWAQQLDAGRPWTTAGRLIRTSRRVGFLVGAIAVLVAMQLAFWPRMYDIILPRTSTGAWVSGIAGHVLLMVALLTALRGTARSRLGWLAAFAAASLATFVLIREQDSLLGEWWGQHWPIALAGLGGVLLSLGAIIRPDSNWRATRESLVITGLVVAPVAAMTGTALIEQLKMPPGTSAVTFAILAGVYLLAARWPGPESFRIPAILCAGVGLWQLRAAFGSAALPSVCLYIALTGLALLVLGDLRGRVRLASAMKWSGALATIGSLLTGLVVR